MSYEYSLRGLDDTTLLAQLHTIVGQQRSQTAQLLAHLAEVEDRKLYAAQACSSMFGYATTVLGFAEGAAYNRIYAARVARRMHVKR